MDRCTNRQMQMAINVNTCKKYAREIRNIKIHRFELQKRENNNIRKLENSYSGYLELGGGERGEDG